MLRTLWAHKLRSFLTMFGIAWEWDRCCFWSALGEGFRSGNRREMNSLGEDIMFVSRPGRRRLPQYEFRPQLQPHDQDYYDIAREAPHVRAVAPVLSRLDIREVSDLRQHQWRSQRRSSALQRDSIFAADGRPLLNEDDESQKAHGRRHRR